MSQTDDTDDETTVEQLKERIDDLEAQIDTPSREQLRPTRRDMLAAAVGAVGLGALTGTASAAPSYGSATGQQGTSSEPLVKTVAQTGRFQDVTVDNALNTEDLDIGGSDLTSTSEFFGRISHNYAVQTFSTSSTSYTEDISQFNLVVEWDDLFSDDQGAVLGFARVTGSVDVRIQNTTDGETVAEVLDGGSFEKLGPSDYTPTTSSNKIELRFQIRSRDGNSVSLDRPQAYVGVQL